MLTRTVLIALDGPMQAGRHSRGNEGTIRDGATLRAMQGTGDRYDRETALIVVDVQNDFADPEGSL